VPDIGATLREARLRQKLDISEVEAATKIRAKYLRALEHEDWDLLPGPTFVRTFLRTYAEYLDLDGRGIVEEYRLSHERGGVPEFAPIAPGMSARRERRRMRPILTPGVLLAVGAIVLVGALYALGRWGNDGDGQTPVTPRQTPQAARDGAAGAETPTRRRRRARPARPQVVSLVVVATGAVYVCAEDRTGADVIDQVVLQAGQRRGPYRSRRFRVTFGNGAAEMRVNGRRVDVPDADTAIGYELRPGRRPRRLPLGSLPTCE
jgi:cytoskeleton protein RodZ